MHSHRPRPQRFLVFNLQATFHLQVACYGRDLAALLFWLTRSQNYALESQNHQKNLIIACVQAIGHSFF